MSVPKLNLIYQREREREFGEGLKGKDPTNEVSTYGDYV